MHPPRRNTTSDPQGIADRLVEWLVAHCPFSTLAVLTVIVISPLTGPVPRPEIVASIVVAADLSLAIVRRLARAG
jgi:hypothetical protein